MTEGSPSALKTPRSVEKGGRLGLRILSWLLLLIPLTAILDYADVSSYLLFLSAVVSMIPLAGFLGRATEEIAIQTTPALGGLLNATFGNAIELLIATQILLGNDPEAPQIVRASIVGSLITNLLLLIGASMLAGGIKYKEQRFNRDAAGVSSSFLIIAFAGLSVPTLFGHFVSAAPVQALSISVSVVISIVYVCGLFFTFLTHRHLFDTTDELRETRRPEWSKMRATLVLAAAVLVVAYLAHVIERTLDGAGHTFGLSKVFVGVIVIGAVTNVAENLSAISYARRNMLDLSFQIGTSSAIQILLFVVPLLVFIGMASGHPFPLQFSLFELGCMLLPVMIINHLSSDGVCNWLEGVQLISLYLIIGLAFYFVR